MYAPFTTNLKVYKTLRVLGELNLVHDLSLKQGDTRFDPYVEPHLNLICERCGIIRDINDGRLKDMIERAAKQTNFSPSG